MFGVSITLTDGSAPNKYHLNDSTDCMRRYFCVHAMTFRCRALTKR